MQPMPRPPDEFHRRLAAVATATEAALMQRLGGATQPGEIARPERLLAAMRHAAGGGKRIRPFLVVEAAALFGVEEKASLPAAAALECIHCYSLVHDDLPAMDDDDLRRGLPTTHRAFDEATAILAGDALLTLAFEMLARLNFDAERRIALVALFAQSAGSGGMVGGQILDLEAEGRFMAAEQPLDLSLADIERLQSMKTGALLSAACTAGGIIGGANKAQRHALDCYSKALGLAFQIADDLLDIEGDATKLGKAAAKDAARGKATLVSLLGVAGARKRLGKLIEEAVAALAPFGDRAAMLQACARYIADRDR
jgi:farnesyl diphosphate synthase